MISEIDQRAAVVEEALSWERTPYHHRARVKGVGCDCGQLPCAVYEAAGMIPPYDPGEYPPDWHLHRGEEAYLEHVERFCLKLESGEPPLPGDLALFRYGRAISHGAIILEWPGIIHAYITAGAVMRDDAVANTDLAKRLVGVWRLKEWC